MSETAKFGIGIWIGALCVISTVLYFGSRPRFHEGDCFVDKSYGRIFKIISKDFDTRIVEGYRDHEQFYFDDSFLEGDRHRYLKISCPVNELK